MPVPGSNSNPWWEKLVVSLEFADLDDADTRERLDSAAAKANNQGMHLAANWQYGSALPMLTAAIEVWTALDQHGGTINARNVRGAIYRKIGDLQAAQADHKEALALATVHTGTANQPTRVGATTAQIGLALAMLAQDDADKAESLAQDALRHSQEADDMRGYALAQFALGRVYETRKAWDAAHTAFETARQQWDAIPAPAEAIEAAAGLARASLGRAQMVDAFSMVQDIFEHLSQHGPARIDEPLRLYWTLYRVLHTARDMENAHEVLRAANMLMLRQMEGLSLEQRDRFRAVPLHERIASAWTDILTAQADAEADAEASAEDGAEESAANSHQ